MSKHAFVFPGQGAQFPGMGQSLYENYTQAKELFEQANEVLGFRISDVMFYGTEAELKQTNVTQPAVFLHSVIAYKCLVKEKPDMVAGHSLGEFSALVANECLEFADALKLVSARANAMQHACETDPGTMAAIIGLEDEVIERICSEIDEEVVPANYNCPGQLVISGSLEGINIACEKLKAAGAKRALPLPVGGAFHSPLMIHAEEELIAAIENTVFHKPICPVYQNVVVWPVSRVADIKVNLMHQ
ncbi:MAG TPA: [acyl-carrier-protein] S-malonyltransferase, partial [Chitinophagaceae bacterium]|nr:[acyl-carrier-protein] S-malonyltransferase [Chitinophagaceae bacterium]